jgi:hypothetical protein
MAGLPWFDYYLEDAPVVNGGKPLANLDSIAALEIKKDEKVLPENNPIPTPIIKNLSPGKVRDNSTAW